MRSYPRHLRGLAVCLATLGGFVDAIAYLQLGGFFVSFMSGNSTRLGAGLVLDPAVASVAASLLGSFVLGVFAGSLTGRAAGKQQRAVVLALVAVGLASAATAQGFGHLHLGTALLAAAMGAENAVFERNGEASFGVTYMTGALVKFAQGLATATTGGDRWGWAAYLVLWFGLVGGVVIGAGVYGSIGDRAVWVASFAATALAILAFGFDRRRRH